MLATITHNHKCDTFNSWLLSYSHVCVRKFVFRGGPRRLVQSPVTYASGVPSFVLTTRIAAPIEQCFALSLSIDAHTGSMVQSAERAVGGVRHGEIGPGETVTWSARHFGIRFRLTSTITEYVRPTRFVDEQVSGPFKRWWHEHEFVAEGDATVMTDRVQFAAPFGVLGRLVDKVMLARYMEHLIAQRNAWLKGELER